MSKIITIAAAALTLALSTSANAAGVCKGLEQGACTSNAACAWAPALVKGQASPTSGKVSKVDRKAHCRAATKPPVKAKAAK